MTEPSTAAIGVPEGQEEEQPALEFPLGWILEHAAGPIAYRSAVEVVRLEGAAGSLAALPFVAPTALRLAVTQSLDGTWGGRMLSVPRAHRHAVQGVGTITAVRRLMEYGWDRETPPLVQARRPLFRLLAADDDPAYLYELAGTGTGRGMALEAVRRGRQILREAAAAALAQAGYESDPRLRGAARRIVERIDTYLESALSEKPWVRVGNRHVLSEDAAPPSVYALAMLAHMPIFRSEHYPQMERLYAYLAQPKPAQEAVQLYGKEVVTQPHLVMGDLLANRNVVDHDVPFAVMWLETMARLGFLRRNEHWLKLLERLVSDRDRAGVWHPHKGTAAPSTENPYVWPSFALEERLEGEARWTDVTFRIGLIARLLGWRIEPV